MSLENAIDMEGKKGPKLVTTSAHYEFKTNNGCVFDTSDGHWYSVQGDMLNEDNWMLVE